MKTKTKKAQGDVALKLDISKEYATLDWEYLRDIMLQMGFSGKWVQWVMLCVETLDYTVLVNNVHIRPLISVRGIRQGDWLSPYIFIPCAKGLSSLISDAKKKRGYYGDSHLYKCSLDNAPTLCRQLLSIFSELVNKKQQS